ncbi:HNH endonuclease [Tessaracoccus coleopterorum]|uniref:HNH endonuclease n=1 Tax=Tessaracoccus coleopterorum TaxID=2714950 RepID=UPI0038CDBD6C
MGVTPENVQSRDWADHVVHWSRGGRTELTNGQMLCREHRNGKAHKMPSRLYRWHLARCRWRY